ncbi:acetylornithine and succinylornithine aminotransferase [Saitoella complicata NRRL Y-17804]|uniref:acetylornithine transaminase n=1 Tax=Saitoella complicata (strain BCRC 22490 / CBS 7301 / JCM 7358 / NBRC 10748 / NRRL Y-17804) TaxID=698492 RepID=A0A0E9NAC4_SAICN|nr:acetylornithine and succinylornithine aminotransferase [Saitoella complicata NRRL Y-17804]ODQ50439.1 acetylornithine and succinylornithine aminotransferase [Saitoella complicata NRRL Y-17804]GAO46651.1 hypothetical protein G7K_0877-t1 [Saitoella complicata NRRL Y-17804]
MTSTAFSMRAITRASFSAAAFRQIAPRTGTRTLATKAVSHPDPSDTSASAKLIEQHKPYALTTYARPNLVFTKGEGCYVWDMEGRKYIDFTAGIAVNALGHGDKEIAKIAYEQALELIHVSNLYHNKWAGELAKTLVETTKEQGGMHGAAKVFFSNSGSEANEGAIKFARKVGKIVGGEDKIGIVSFKNAFHGRTMGSLSATPNPKYQAPFAPMVPGFSVGEFNNVEQINTLITEKTCGVIVEPVQGEGGIFAGSVEFLSALRKRCDEVNAVLIYDEIQCGLGRTGDLWAHTILPKDCHPDILTMAKPLANGIPIGAIMVNNKVADAVKIGDHGTTFGGNPFACRIAHHVFTRLASPSLQSNVRTMSTILKSKLESYQKKYPTLITDIRGRGLLMGMQLAIDPTPVVGLARERGLLIITAGNNTVRFVPPLVITEKELEEGLKIVEEALGEMAKNM